MTPEQFEFDGIPWPAPVDQETVRRLSESLARQSGRVLRRRRLVRRAAAAALLAAVFAAGFASGRHPRIPEEPKDPNSLQAEAAPAAAPDAPLTAEALSVRFRDLGDWHLDRGDLLESLRWYRQHLELDAGTPRALPKASDSWLLLRLKNTQQ